MTSWVVNHGPSNVTVEELVRYQDCLFEPYTLVGGVPGGTPPSQPGPLSLETVGMVKKSSLNRLNLNRLLVTSELEVPCASHI